MDHTAEQKNKELAIRTIAMSTALLACLVAALMVWQAYRYSGVFAWLAELQFRYFDRMFPVSTILLITLLLCLPLLILLAFRIRRHRKLYGRPSATALLGQAQFFGKFLAGFAALTFIGALVAMITGFAIGSLSEKPTAILSFEAGSKPADGYIDTRALVLTNRIGYYSEAVPIGGRTLYVAPVVASQDSKLIKYFAEIPRQKAVPAQRQKVSGFLRAQSVPGGLERLYQNAGYTIDQPTFVIFSDHASARWPWFSAAANLGFLGLLLALGYLLNRNSIRRRKRNLESGVNQEA